jgi:alpha-glutamyl/putrescinyl thymine pyrophosphorylase clade 1
LTTDPILRLHRFTNAYRAADRVSQYLIQRVIYPDGQTYGPDETLFRILLFKFFNRIETWELLDEALGGIRWSTYSFSKYDRVLTRAIDSGRRIYSAAYIMPACGALADGRKHRGHLRLIEMMIGNGVAGRLAAATGMAQAFGILQTYPMMGDFLAFQYTIDLNYSTLTDYSEGDFVVPGPGARDGLRKVFADPGDYSEADLVRFVADRQEQEFARLGLPFRNLWGRRLQLIDCQNLFCEVDKYARVHHPDVVGLSGRTRIKQRYESRGPTPAPWFPPKWRLNETIQGGRSEVAAKATDTELFAAFA